MGTIRMKLAAAFLALSAPVGTGAESFTDLQLLIKPQPGEAKWTKVPWETSLQRARERSVREDKPLFLWRAGGGDVLGRA
jgi:hypothetical protein